MYLHKTLERESIDEVGGGTDFSCIHWWERLYLTITALKQVQRVKSYPHCKVPLALRGSLYYVTLYIDMHIILSLHWLQFEGVSAYSIIWQRQMHLLHLITFKPR